MIPLRKSISPFGDDLRSGWLGSLRLYLYKPLGCVSTPWNWVPTGKDITIHYQKVFGIPENIPYPPVGLDVGTDFTWMSIMLPNGTLIGKPFKIIHSDPQSRELTTSKIKGTQEMYPLESRCFLKSIGTYHVPLLCFPRDKGSDYTVTNPTIIKNSTNMNARELHNNKSDSKKAAKVGLNVSLEAPIIPDGVIINLRNLVRDYYYSKDLQSTIVLRFHMGLKVSFPAYLNTFSKVTTQTPLKLLKTYPLVVGMLAAPKDELVEITRNTVCFGETYALARYDAICTTAKDAVILGRALPSNALRIRSYIKMYREYQAHLDNILEELHQAVGKPEGMPDCDHIFFIQTLHGVGLLSVIALITEMGSFDSFSSLKKPYACFGLGPGINDSDRFHEDRVRMPKRGSSLARRTLCMVAINNLRVDKATKTPADPVICDYYTRKCTSKKKSVTVGAAMYKICDVAFTMFRDNKPFELITPEEHRGHYAAEHPKPVNPVV